LLFLLLLVVPSHSQDTGPCRLEEPQCKELMAYRQYFPALADEIKQMKAAGAQSGAAGAAYDAYLQKFYAQANEYRDIRIAMYKWQRTIATWVFASVCVLTILGIALAVYQLVAALKMGNAIKDAQLEVSATKLVVTTSSVGVIVLFLSLAFFFIFAKMIYPVLPAAAIN
jgi:ABC-type multidrug transport system fused ATPase/permease subunit